MTRLGSEFLKALDSYERPVLGYMTLRQLVLLFGIALTVVVTTILYWLKAPDIILYGVDILLLAPFVIFGCYIDEKIKEKLNDLDYVETYSEIEVKKINGKWKLEHDFNTFMNEMTSGFNDIDN